MRTVIRIAGEDREPFLQNLVTNDVEKLKDGLVYAALLTPQGKYLADFFLVPDKDSILLDVDADLATGLAQRLRMYKLRSDVTIDETDILVARGLGTPQEGAFADPRHPDLGWRAYDGRANEDVAFETVRVNAGVPETGIELIPNESYPLEMGFERLNGVDFKKGCYVGQEVTARMKHKTELRKGLRKVAVDGEAPVGTEIVNGEGRPAGTLYSQSAGQALAYLRFDRVDGPLRAGDATVTVAA